MLQAPAGMNRPAAPFPRAWSALLVGTGVLASAACPWLGPDAALSVSPCVTVDSPTLLDASLTHAGPGGAPLTYRFDPGDGSQALITPEARTLHTWHQAAQYDVSVVVTDADGLDSRATVTVQVVNGAVECGPTQDGGPQAQPEIAVDVCRMNGVLDCLVDLGEVPLEGEATAVVTITNVGNQRLIVDDLLLKENSAGVFSMVVPPLLQLAPAQQAVVTLLMSPQSPGSFGALLEIHSNAGNLPAGRDSVEVELRAVTPETPFARLDVSPLLCDFGAIPYGSRSNCQVQLRSSGTLPVTVDAINVTTDQGGAFSPPPWTSRALAVGAMQTVDLGFLPPSVGTFVGEALVVSTDPALPRRTISLVGRGVETPPLAVPRVLRVNGQLVGPGELGLRPLDDVELTGVDSRAGRPERRVVSYRWELLQKPQDSTVLLTDGASMVTALAFNSNGVERRGLDVVGTYVVGLTVTDDVGVRNGSPALLTLVTRPDADLHIQLTWEDTQSDVDLHLVQNVRANRFSQQDCYYANCVDRRLHWFDQEVANPRLDVDDTDGNGPENLAIPRPNNGRYFVGVHLFARHGHTGDINAHVKIFVGGTLRVERSRSMSGCQSYWTVAQLDWQNSAATIGTLDELDTVDSGICD